MMENPTVENRKAKRQTTEKTTPSKNKNSKKINTNARKLQKSRRVAVENSVTPVKRKKRSSSDQKQITNKAKNGANKQNSHSYRQVPPSKGKRIITVIWDMLFYLFLFAMVGGAVFFNFNDSPDRSFFGYRFMTVLTNSMSTNPEKPELTDGFDSGSIIIIQQANPEELEVGDIITFYPVAGNTEAYLTHRVIEVAEELEGEEGTFITTQGDANSGADIPIRGDQVVGRVIFAIPFVGNFLNFVRENIVIVALFIAAVFAFFVTLKYYLGIKDYRQVPAKQRPRKRVANHR